MKAVFLDIDGVLVTGETVSKGVRVDGHHFNPFAQGPVFQLNKILQETGSNIVISSSWRCKGPRWEALLKHFKEQGIIRRPCSRTPHLESKTESGVYVAVQRGEEIKQWLQMHTGVTDFVVLDDDSDMDAVRSNFVHVKNGMFRGGLLASHANAAIQILGRAQ